MSSRSKLVLIILASLFVYLVGNNRTALWDRDEPRYAQTSRQMLQSGDWVVPRLLDEVRTAKPIFIYWCQASAMWVFGDNDFAARFPSSAAMVGTLIVVAIVVGRLVGAKRALWTVFILASSALVVAAAKMCLTDAVLLLFVTVAQVCLGIIYVRKRDVPPMLPEGMRRADDVIKYGAGLLPERRGIWVVPAVMWVAIGLAGLTKGPVVLGISFTTMIVLAAMDVQDRRAGMFLRRVVGWWRQTRPVMGIGILVVICGPWLILIHLRAPGFLHEAFGHEVVDRMRSGLEGHKGPPGYYLLLIWGAFFPWSLFLPATAVQAWKRRNLPAIRFAIAAIIGPWILFECVQTKLPFYILPVFPMLAFLTADMLVRARRNVHQELTNRGFVNFIFIWAIIVVLVASIPWISMRFFRGELNSIAVASMILITICAVGTAILITYAFRLHHPTFAAAIMGIGTMVLVVLLYVGYFPNAQFLRLSPRVAALLRADHAEHPIMIDYKEDTLPWYQGGTIRGQRDNDFLIDHPATDWPRWIVLTRHIWQNMPPAIQQQFDVQGPVHGWAYSDGGRIVDLYVLRKKSS